MINYLIAGLLGLLFMTLAKAQSTKKDFEVANQKFVWKKFLQGEMIAIGMSLVVIVLMAFTVKEWMNVSPKVKDYVSAAVMQRHVPSQRCRILMYNPSSV